MISACTPDFFQRACGFGLESELPVFVVGLPRSGTTLIEQILAGHSQVFGAGETTLARDTLAALFGPAIDPDGGFRGLEREAAQSMASQHLQKLRSWNGTATRIVDKMPDNYLHLGLMACLFPQAKFIHCRRDLRDVAVSCWMTHFRELRWANDPRHIASRFHDYQRLMEHWRKVLPVPLLEVDYEDVVADLEAIPAPRVVVRFGVGANVPGIPPTETAGENGQRRPGPAADLRDFRGQMEALRAGPGFAVHRDSTVHRAVPDGSMRRIGGCQRAFRYPRTCTVV